MENRTALKDRVRSLLPTLVVVFCVLQPLLDAAGFWQQRLGVGNALTTGLRMLLLGGSVLLGFWLSTRRRYYWMTAAVLGVLTALHVTACLQFPNGYVEPVTDLVNLVRIWFLPMTTLCFATFLRQNDRVFSAMKRGMLIDLALILLIQLLSAATGTNPFTYENDKIGILGWFVWTNSQSAILAMLCPLAVCAALQKWEKRLLPVALVTAAAEAALFILGPRLSYASLIAGGLGVAVCLLISNRGRWKQAVVIVLVTCLFVGAYPWSPTHARLSSVDRLVQQKQVHKIDSVDVTIVPETVPGGREEYNLDAQDDNTREKLEMIYRAWTWGAVERFGLERVVEAYDYSLDAAVLGNNRTKKLVFCTLLMEDAGLLSKLFGLNLMEMREWIPEGFYNPKINLWEDGYENYDVENDFHGVYFLTGWAGLGAMAVFLLWFGLRALWRLIRHFRALYSLDLICFAAAYLFGLIHAYFTASVLRRTNASVYLALILAGLWYLSREELFLHSAAAAPERERSDPNAIQPFEN